MAVVYLAKPRPQTLGAWHRHRRADCLLPALWL